ncbi:MAG: carboxypeptidase-like regulatory domain-containing protein, partial [Oscillospiraceae bacterium]
VSIKNAETGEIYATAIPAGRFYAADLSLNVQNSVKLVAEAVKGGNTLRSAPRTVTVTNQPVTVQTVTYNQTAAQQNSRLGFFSFWQYMDMELMGSSLSLQTQFANGDAIAAVTYHFCDQEYPATKAWNGWDATFKGWGGSGLKPITATVTLNGGQKLELVVAEVTLLIDPSGVVTDQNDKPLAGVTVTCQIKNGDLWTDWDAESTGQINPQVTGADGKYGWMVPDGSYRILATCPGYAPYDSLLDSNTSNNSILIPPPRTDVNFKMTPVPQAIVALPAENGTVVASVNTANAQMATPGETVSVTVTAKSGYRIKGLLVADESGKAVPVTDAATGLSLAAETTDTKTYTFTMPGSTVRIRANISAPVTLGITSATYANGQLTVQLTGAPVSGGTYYVAAYNDTGRLLGITSANASGEIHLSLSGTPKTVKAFLLDAQGSPLGTAATYTITK